MAQLTQRYDQDVGPHKCITDHPRVLALLAPAPLEAMWEIFKSSKYIDVVPPGISLIVLASIYFSVQTYQTWKLLNCFPDISCVSVLVVRFSLGVGAQRRSHKLIDILTVCINQLPCQRLRNMLF